MSLCGAGPDHVLGKAVLFAAALSLWLLNHPYQGIWHDAQIYGLLAAHSLAPEALAADLFFIHGSQGSWSLFTPIYGALVGAIGLDRAAWWVTLGGGIGWVAASFWAAWRMLGKGPALVFAIVLAAVANLSYAPNADTFLLTENFATARCWAIPAGLASVAALVAGRRGWALGWSLAATALHPLLGIWPLALWLLMHLSLNAGLLLGASALLAALLLGWLALDLPYLRPMSGDWLDFARDTAPDIMFRAGRPTHLQEFGGVLAALWLGARRGGEAVRQLYWRALLLGIVGLGLALISSRVFPVEIIVQGQPWRVMALLIPLAVLALLDVAQRASRASGDGVLAALAAATAAALVHAWRLPAIYVLGCAALVPGHTWRRLDNLLLQRRRFALIALAGIWLALLPGIAGDLEIAGRKLLNPWWEGAEAWHGLLAGGSWHVAALLAAASLWRPRRQVLSAGIALVALAVALIAILPEWDRRSSTRRIAESCYLDARCAPHPFRAHVKAGEVVFWPQRELSVWFEVQRASFHGELQRTGAVFSQAKFDEWTRREAWLAERHDAAAWCAAPMFEWLVLAHAQPNVMAKSVHRGAYLYACADIRGAPPAPTSALPPP